MDTEIEAKEGLAPDMPRTRHRQREKEKKKKRKEKRSDNIQAKQTLVLSRHTRFPIPIVTTERKREEEEEEEEERTGRRRLVSHAPPFYRSSWL